MMLHLFRKHRTRRPMLTLTVYSHVTPTMQRGAADQLDALLSSKG
jgi:hypothetical protein